MEFLIFFPLAYGILCYVFRALGLSGMLSKVGYEKPYLAWIPFADIWAFGRLAEKYDNEKPQENIGRQLLSVYIVMTVTLFIAIVSIVFIAIAPNEDITAFIALFITIPAFIVGYIFAIKCTIRQYLALWKILRIFVPNAAVGLLFLCIFVPALPFVFFSIRKNDPQNLRHEDTSSEENFQDPMNPYYIPYPQQPQYPQYPQYPQNPQYPQSPQAPDQQPPENPYKY